MKRAAEVSILAFTLAVVGCGHAPPVALDRGTSSFAVVEPPPAPPPKANVESAEPLDRGQYRQEQLVQPAALPVYPARALKAKAGRATVGVHITVDSTGRVSNIQSSMLVFSTPGPCADDFRDAVEAALHQWRFVPARIEYIETVTSNGFAYKREINSENVDAELDLSFTFTADGKVEL